MLIRRAEPSDAEGIARVLVAAWRAAYRGLLPDETLDRLSVRDFERRWRERIAARPTAANWGPIFVAEQEDEIVGFVACGSSQDEDVDRERVGEIYVIYVHPDHWRQGVGTALLAKSVARLRRDGFEEAILWVLRGNQQAIAFYEGAGFEADGASRVKRRADGVEMPIVRYRAPIYTRSVMMEHMGLEDLAVLQYLSNTSQDRTTDRQSIYRAIGVEPIINCRGTFTIIGGSVQRPEALAAAEQAARHFVQYDELAEAVGRRLAEITGAEWGMISAGCAAGLKHVTAACVTGGNPEKLIRIPDLTGMDKTQVIAPRYSRNAYDHAVRNVGVEMVVVETPAELERAINHRTAMIYLVAGRGSEGGQPLSLETIVEIAKPAGIPVLVDAAAEDLTIPCVHLDKGADVVAYSGGKAMCGPQSAGLLLGDKRILMSAWQASSPHHGPNRDNKIGREEIVAMLAAVEAWVIRDHAAEWQTWLSRLDQIAQRVSQIAGVETEVEQPSGLSNRAPRLKISWDPAALHISGEQVAEDFARNKPRIALAGQDAEGRACIRITPSQMRPGDEQIVAERIYQTLTQARTPQPAELSPAQVDISGHWDLTVEYWSSTSQHRLYLQQEGNWVKGMHHSEYSSQEIVGTIEGDRVKLRSQVYRPGDRIPFLFSGRACDEGLSGSVYLGEYLTAQFTAKRSTYRELRKPFVIPGGPPLAT